MFKKIIRNRNYFTIYLTIFIFGIIFILSFFDIFYGLDKKYQNFTYKKLDSRVSNDLIVVEIDDKSLEKLGYPLDRKVYIPFIENLTKEGVSVIGFDIIFADKSNNEKSDLALSEAIKKSKNIVLGLSVNNDDTILDPYFLFKNGIINSGFLRPKIDKKNDITYSIVPQYFFKPQKLIENFSLAVLKAYYSYIYNTNYNDYIYGEKENYYNLTPNIKIPLSKNNGNDYRYGEDLESEILINYIDRKKFFENGNIISFYDIYNEQNFENLKNNIDFKEKIILVGFTAKGIKDVFDTPNGKEYGVYIHANMINTILTKSYLVYFDKSIEWILILLLIISSVYFNLSRSGIILFVSNIIILFLFLIIFPFSILSLTNLIVNYPSELSFSLLLSLTLTNIVKFIIENKDKNRLNQALSDYVSRDIAHEILSGEGRINLDGEEKKISIFFSDIEGFTSISEKLKADELVGFMRIYLSKMSDIIIEESGFINKYEGDSIMGLWGVFGEYNNAGIKACFAAIKQQRLLKQLNNEWIKVLNQEINVRIGIHLGKAIIGNIGSKGKKLEFTALGDNVNLASRLEGVNKHYKTSICVSEDVFQEAKDYFEFRYLDTIKVKGKEIGVKIYELLEEKGKLNLKQIDIKNKFEKAIDLYLNKNFKEALEIFSILYSQGDNACLTYINRCEMYLINPPLENWNGIWQMKEK